eukprot:TRINITY_DN15468_c0_g1_i3.p1 TRINITY_DN15468_c0_g1~~TRINITY_DN15468_c0_g1_i3.p1  ORF type:complete len:428 (-),score=117.39 TRINITY_DN15468_c0_g1_i3:444-1727(-)
MTIAKRMLREVLLLRALDHPNVINIVSMWHNDNDIYLAEPLMEADLHRVIRSSQPLTDDHFQFFIWQILRALKYMHSANVIHRDLKPANILVNSDCSLKICDFGLARAVEEEEENKTMYVVTRWYRAPELMIADDYSEAVDLWAVGCIVAEFLGRRAIFPGKNSMHQLQLITSVLGPIKPEDLKGYKKQDVHANSLLQSVQDAPVPQSFESRFPKASHKALDLLRNLLEYHPSKRPTAVTALEHPWLAEHHLLQAEPEAEKHLDFEFEHLLNASPATLCDMLLTQAPPLDGPVRPEACRLARQDLELPPLPGARSEQHRSSQQRTQPGLSPANPHPQEAWRPPSVPPSPKSPAVGSPIDIDPEAFHSITAYTGDPNPDPNGGCAQDTRDQEQKPPAQIDCNGDDAGANHAMRDGKANECKKCRCSIM